jgi:hypothetical protein
VFGANWRTRLAYLLIRKQLTAMRERFDPSEYGGAPLLGVSGVSIIAHGSSNPKAIRNAIRAASNEQLVHRVNPEILEILGKIQPDVPVKPAGKGFRALFSKMRSRLNRREKEEARARPDKEKEQRPPDGQHEPAPNVDERSPNDLKIELARYESTHSSSHADGAAAPAHNGVATNDKKHTSGELKSAPDESSPDDDSPDHQKN